MRINRIVLVIALIVVTAFGSALFLSPDNSAPVFAQESGSLLDVVRDRGVLNCGVSGQLPGFSNPNPDTGVMEGLDADYCRALAAAIWGEATEDNVNFVSLTANERFAALQAGQVDVLNRNTTWTLTRDTTNGSDFGPTTFYDGQGLMTKVDLGVSSIEDLDGATFCTTTGTTTEKNLANALNDLGFQFEVVGVEDASSGIAAFEEGACDVLTSDKSQLAALRSASSDPSSMVILGDTLSKEPLGPMYLDGDAVWADLVNWTVYATFQAEELGITSANIEEFMGSDETGVRLFLGEEGTLGEQLGLDNTFAMNIIKAVGNYGEIYERNIVPIGIPRENSLNALWTNGGMMYAPAWL